MWYDKYKNIMKYVHLTEVNFLEDPYPMNEVKVAEVALDISHICGRNPEDYAHSLSSFLVNSAEDKERDNIWYAPFDAQNHYRIRYRDRVRHFR